MRLEEANLSIALKQGLLLQPPVTVLGMRSRRKGRSQCTIVEPVE